MYYLSYEKNPTSLSNLLNKPGIILGKHLSDVPQNKPTKVITNGDKILKTKTC